MDKAATKMGVKKSEKYKHKEKKIELLLSYVTEVRNRKAR
jgi:hypothetical protein